MKKILLIAVIALLASCTKKEYTCNCSSTLSDGTQLTGSSYQVEASNKDEANDNCGQNGKAINVDSGGITHACKIK